MKLPNPFNKQKPSTVALYKSLLCDPHSAIGNVQKAGFKDILRLLLTGLLVYSVLEVVVNLSLIVFSGAISSSASGPLLVALALFAGFFGGALLVTLAYSLVFHVISLAFGRKSTIMQTFGFAVASLTPVYLFSWLSPVVRTGGIVATVFSAGNPGIFALGQILAGISSQLFSAFSIWVLWTLVIQFVAFSSSGMKFHSAIKLTIISAIVFVVIWILLGSVPLAVVQPVAGF